jgi:small subunit ribosomal protein S15e
MQQKAEKTAAERYAELKKKRTFKKFQYRGVDLDNLIDLPYSELVEMFNSRQRRRCSKGGMGGQYNRLTKKLRASKLLAQSKGPHEKPVPVKTHLRNMIVLPDMIGSIVAVYNGKHFNIVEVKPAMVGRYLGEFSITYKPVSHGRPGIGATSASAFIPLH